MEPYKVERVSVVVRNMGWAVVTQSRYELEYAKGADFDLYMEHQSSPVEPVFYWANRPMNQGDRVAATIVDFVQVNPEDADVLSVSIHTAPLR